jgi:hypothetical protein
MAGWRGSERGTSTHVCVGGTMTIANFVVVGRLLRAHLGNCSQAGAADTLCCRTHVIGWGAVDCYNAFYGPAPPI